MSMCVPFLKNKISDYHFVYLLCEFHCSFSCYYFSRNWTLVKQLNFALLYCITNRGGYRGCSAFAGLSGGMAVGYGNFCCAQCTVRILMLRQRDTIKVNVKTARTYPLLLKQIS